VAVPKLAARKSKTGACAHTEKGERKTQPLTAYATEHRFSDYVNVSENEVLYFTLKGCIFNVHRRRGKRKRR